MGATNLFGVSRRRRGGGWKEQEQDRIRKCGVHFFLLEVILGLLNAAGEQQSGPVVDSELAKAVDRGVLEDGPMVEGMPLHSGPGDGIVRLDLANGEVIFDRQVWGGSGRLAACLDSFGCGEGLSRRVR